MTLSLDELDSHLFECADIIRDAVDPTDYKEYILPLVYCKSISDEFWSLVGEHDPDYMAHVEWLTEHSTELIFSSEDL